jgi:hypothetical protein
MTVVGEIQRDRKDERFDGVKRGRGFGFGGSCGCGFGWGCGCGYG